MRLPVVHTYNIFKILNNIDMIQIEVAHSSALENNIQTGAHALYHLNIIMKALIDTNSIWSSEI